MDRRSFIKSSGVVSTAALAVQVQAGGNAKIARRPNILMITCHDLGQHLGCYGVKTVNTDNIDALASKGVRFHNFYSTSAVCSPGRGSLHTGRYPQSNGLMGLTHAPWWWNLHDDERLTPQILGELGYNTNLIGVQHIAADSKRLGYNKVYKTKHKATDTVRDVSEFLQQAKPGEQPFFIKAGFQEVHRRFVQGTDTERGVFIPPYLADTPVMREDLAAFQGTIKYFDERVGEIINAVESSSVADNTLILLTSEHGIPYPGAKWCVRKAGFEIPLIAYQPNSVFAGGKVYNEVMSNVDVLPTLLDYLNEPVPPKMEGVSYLPFMEQKTDTPPRTEAFAQYTPDMKRDNLSRCVINERYHLIRYFDQGRTVRYPTDVVPQDFASHIVRCRTKGPRPFVQLFDIQDDPYELKDLGQKKEYAPIIKELSNKLTAWMTAVKDPLLKEPFRTPYYDQAMEDLWEKEG